MGELEGLAANIKYYEGLLRTSSERPQREIIARLLAEECDKLRKGLEIASSPPEPAADDAESSTLDDDSVEGDDRAQWINYADPAAATGHRAYGSFMSFLTRIAGRPLKPSIKVRR
jgi:hypothetical protein